MLNVLRPLLLIAALAAMPSVQAETARAQRDDAGARVRQVERDGGRVLQAQPMQRGGQEVYRLKVLTPEGRVRVLQEAPQERARPPEPRTTRSQAGPRSLGNRSSVQDQQMERARERRANAAGRGGDPARD